MKYFLFALFTLISLTQGAQTKREADSLAEIIKGGKDSNKVMAWTELARLASGNSNAKAFEFSYKALKLSEKIKNAKLIAASLNRLGTVFDYNAEPDSAAFCLLKALAIYEQLNDEKGKGDVYQNLGVMYYYQEDFANAHKYYNLAAECRKRTNDEKMLAQLYNNIGALYRNEKKYDDALRMYELALPLKEKFKDLKSLSATYLNMSTLFAIKKDYKKAFELADKALKIDEQLNNPDDLAKTLLMKSEYVQMSGDTRKARDMIDQSLVLLNQTGNPDQIFKAYEMRSIYDSLLGDYKSAVRDLHLSNKYKSKVFKQEKAMAIEKLQVIYETGKKDQEIELLNMENEAKEKRQNLLYVISALVIVLLGISLIFYRKKTKDNLLLARQKQEIIEKTEQIKFQAEEIARHRSQMNPHFLFNALNALQGNILKSDNEKALAQLNLLSKLMRQTLNNSEKEWISIEEEEKYLESYVQFEKQRLDFDFSFIFKVETEIDTGNTGVPPMLIQPLIENSIKHARLREVQKPTIICNVHRKDDSLVLSIRDNGKGRIKPEGNSHQSMALGIIESRVKELNEKAGKISMEAFKVIDHEMNGEPGGTETVLIIPYYELI